MSRPAPVAYAHRAPGSTGRRRHRTRRGADEKRARAPPLWFEHRDGGCGLGADHRGERRPGCSDASPNSGSKPSFGPDPDGSHLRRRFGVAWSRRMPRARWSWISTAWMRRGRLSPPQIPIHKVVSMLGESRLDRVFDRIRAHFGQARPRFEQTSDSGEHRPAAAESAQASLRIGYRPSAARNRSDFCTLAGASDVDPRASKENITTAVCLTQRSALRTAEAVGRQHPSVPLLARAHAHPASCGAASPIGSRGVDARAARCCNRRPWTHRRRWC